MRHVLVFALLAGCTGQGVLAVTVDATEPVYDISRLLVVVENLGERATAEFDFAAPVDVPPVQTLNLVFDSHRTGTARVTVHALDEDGFTLASGSAPRTLAAGKVRDVRVYLGSAPKGEDMGDEPDLGDEEDLTDEEDLAHPDLAMGPDLARLPDLAPAPDLARAPDLAKAPDLARPPDLAVRDLLAPIDLARLPDVAIPADLTPRDIAMAPDLIVYPPPGLEGVWPDNGPNTGGITVSIFGGGFVGGPGLQVRIGGVLAANVKLVSAFEVTATLPAAPGKWGPVDVTVTNPDGGSHTLVKGFTYYLAAISFAAAVPYMTAGDVRDVALVDLDKVAGPDVVAANGVKNAVSWLLNRGDGTLAPWKQQDLPGAGMAVAGLHLNGDGVPDVAVSIGGTVNAVGSLLGAGGGALGTAKTYPAGGALPRGIAVGDLDGDGWADVAVATADRVSVLYGKNDGSFDAAATACALAGPGSGIVAGDFNRDQKPDLATAAAGSLVVCLGKGGRAWAPPVSFFAGMAPVSVVAADFDDDGELDLAAVSTLERAVACLSGIGNGSFDPAVSSAVGKAVAGLDAADIDGSGIPDLVVANDADGLVTVMRGGGDCKFTVAGSWIAGGTVPSVRAGNLDGDGKLDLVAADQSGGTVRVLRNTSQ